jgi:lysophospholipase L1-like esterase
MASLAVAVVVAELAVRVIYGKKFGPRPGFYVADKRLGWKPTTNLDHTFYGPDYEIPIRTDTDGYRLGALGEVDYSNNLVVVCGDSYAFGWGVSTDETFASYLDELLYEASDGETRVVNLGVGGYGLFQSCDRLDEFFQAHPEVEVEAVIVQHTVNDAIDNCKSIGYHFEMWDIIDKHKSRSRFHLVNLVGYARQVLSQHGRAKSRKETEKNHPYVQDLLWAYQRQGRVIGYPVAVIVEGRRIGIDKNTLYNDWDADALMVREKMSRVQRHLTLEALHCIHKVCATYGVTTVHVFVTTTPDWYVQEVTELALESAKFREVEVVVTGPLPEPGEFDGSITTGHSGGHFNAEFNRLWAEKVAAILNDK